MLAGLVEEFMFAGAGWDGGLSRPHRIENARQVLPITVCDQGRCCRYERNQLIFVMRADRCLHVRPCCICITPAEHALRRSIEGTDMVN